MPEGTLLQRAGLRYLTRHPSLAALSLLGVALGVATVVAMDLANTSARRAFEASVDSVAGAATHHVVAGTDGLPERLYARLQRAGGMPAMTPVVAAHAVPVAGSGRSLRLLGIDPWTARPFRTARTLGLEPGAAEEWLNEPGTAVLSRSAAERLGAEAGDVIELRLATGRAELEVVGIAATRGLAGLVVTDIATAQELLRRTGELTRIDVLARDDAALARLREHLPEGVRLEPAERRSRTMREMTRAFSINLTALSLLALVVGMFLIYNTMTFAVVQRRPLLATLRTLGVTRARIFAMVLAEAAAFGIAGTVLGLLLGWILAGHLVELVTRTINDLYFVVRVGGVHWSLAGVLQGLALGVGAAVAAAMPPALEASRARPRVALARSTLEAAARRRQPVLALAGAGAAGVAALLLAAAPASLFWGYAALTATVAAIALWVPPLTAGFARLAAGGLPGRVPVFVRLAVRGIGAGLSRTGVAVTALVVALATTVGVAVMIDSFRGSVGDWLTHTLTADLYVGPPEQAPEGATLDPGLAERLAGLEGVARVTSARGVTLDSPDGPVLATAFELHREAFDGFRLLAGDRASAWQAFTGAGRDPPALLASEPLARHRGLGPGDRLELYTSRGLRAFEVAGIYQDYSSDRGRVAMSRATYRRYWNDASITGIGLYISDRASADAVAAAVRRRAGPGKALEIRSSRRIRERSLAIFDRTFAITEVMRVLALVVSVIGVMSALTALQLERTRELGVYRALGMTPLQVAGLIVGQTTLLGLWAGLLAIPSGLALAGLLVEVINRRAFGWTMTFSVPPEVAAKAVLAAVLAALAASLVPAWRMARVSPAAALREE